MVASLFRLFVMSSGCELSSLFLLAPAFGALLDFGGLDMFADVCGSIVVTLGVFGGVWSHCNVFIIICKPNLGLHKPILGLKPNLGLHKPNLGLHKPNLGFPGII